MLVNHSGGSMYGKHIQTQKKAPENVYHNGHWSCAIRPSLHYGRLLLRTTVALSPKDNAKTVVIVGASETLFSRDLLVFCMHTAKDDRWRSLHAARYIN